MTFAFVSEHDIPKRNQLLQAALRPGKRDYSITDEYPIVLNANEHRSSLCLYDDSRRIIAHLSLWPRHLRVSAECTIPIGLVGNVATHAEFRGQGMMRRLFTHLFDQASQSGLQALALWSDLTEFYQKLGFVGFGQEVRFCILKSGVEQILPDTRLKFEDPATISSADLTTILDLRYPIATIERSVEDFHRLLKIPDTVLLTIRNPDISAYIILGKGADMVGVVHEWGALTPPLLGPLFRHILLRTGWPQLWVLAPGSLSDPWLSYFRSLSSETTLHPLALGRFSSPSIREKVEQAFIWGLDAI